MSQYHINLLWSDEDRSWVADIPDLKYCSALGETPARALSEVEDAKDAWIESARVEGGPVPEPRYRPAIYQVNR